MDDMIQTYYEGEQSVIREWALHDIFDFRTHYSTYQIPKVFFSNPLFKGMPNDAKLLYGLMLDRMQFSVRNGWVDEYDRLYIYYTVESIIQDLGCGEKKVMRLLTELENGYGLIERKRQGSGRPTIIYVKNVTAIPFKMPANNPVTDKNVRNPGSSTPGICGSSE